MRFLLVHIGDPSSNQATSLESQVIHMIQELFGQTFREVRLRQRSRLPKLAQKRRQGPMDIKGHFLMRQVTISTAFAAGLVFSSGATGQTSGLAIAAQQPASVISTAPAPPGDTIRQALARREITYANVWADDKGQTHVTKCVLKGLQWHAFAPPAAPYASSFLCFPQDGLGTGTTPRDRRFPGSGKSKPRMGPRCVRAQVSSSSTRM